MKVCYIQVLFRILFNPFIAVEATLRGESPPRVDSISVKTPIASHVLLSQCLPRRPHINGGTPHFFPAQTGNKNSPDLPSQSNRALPPPPMNRVQSEEQPPAVPHPPPPRQPRKQSDSTPSRDEGPPVASVTPSKGEGPPVPSFNSSDAPPIPSRPTTGSTSSKPAKAPKPPCGPKPPVPKNAVNLTKSTKSLEELSLSSKLNSISDINESMLYSHTIYSWNIILTLYSC